MKEKMCCFDGEVRLPDKAKTDKLRNVIIQLIEKEGVKRFCFMEKSGLDSTATAILKELKNKYREISIGLVFPNIDIKTVLLYEESLKEYDFFLSDKISFQTENGWKIKKWNYYMVDCSDYLVCDITTKWGRATDTLKYAEEKGNIRIINIAKM